MKPGFWKGLIEWLGGGGRWAWSESSRRCRKCGLLEPVGGVSYALIGRPGGWSIQSRLARAILFRRTMILNPLIYLSSFVLGAILGAALDVLLGWSWWLAALGFPVALWLISLASAFFGRRGQRDLRKELLHVLNPGGAWDRDLREMADVFRSCPFPFYGLDHSWTGPRMIGGHSSDGENITSVELTHGDMSTKGPWVRVETAPSNDESIHDLQHAAIQLWHESQPPPADLPRHLVGAWMQRRFEESVSREAHWITVLVSVDKTRVDFDWLWEDLDWVAQAVIGDLIVTIRGHELPVESVRLQTVHNIEPYIEGHRRFLEEQRRLHESDSQRKGPAR